MDILDILPTELRLKVQDCLINSKRMVVGKVIGKGMLSEVKGSQGVVYYQGSNITGKVCYLGSKVTGSYQRLKVTGKGILSRIKGHRVKNVIRNQK